MYVNFTESSNPEWWFVRKHLTEEKGWVPAVYLRDEVSYNRYVQRKLHEKIDKLPIFQSKFILKKVTVTLLIRDNKIPTCT